MSILLLCFLVNYKNIYNAHSSQAQARIRGECECDVKSCATKCECDVKSCATKCECDVKSCARKCECDVKSCATKCECDMKSCATKSVHLLKLVWQFVYVSGICKNMLVEFFNTC